MKKILTEAVAVGNATARAIAFRNRDRQRVCTRRANGKTGSSAGITAGSTATAWPAGTSTPGRYSSTSRP